MSTEDEISRTMREASFRLDFANPELAKRIDDLDHNQYGRGIALGDPRDPENLFRLIGYILPLNPTRQRHLIMFKSGTTLAISQKNAQQNYEDRFSPNPDPITYSNPSWTPSSVEVDFASGAFGLYTVDARSDIPDHEQKIQESISQAMQFARQLREEKERVKKKTVDHLISEIDQLLNPGKS